MNVPITPYTCFWTRPALASCVYAAALFLLGCTAGGLDPVVPNDSGKPTIVASGQAVGGAAGAAEATATGEGASLTDYDAHLARIRAGDCRGLGACIGTRGRCLVIIEHRIDTAWESYYDPATGDLVAQYVYDPMSGFEDWMLGYTDCGEEQFVQDDFVVCGS